MLHGSKLIKHKNEENRLSAYDTKANNVKHSLKSK